MVLGSGVSLWLAFKELFQMSKSFIFMTKMYHRSKKVKVMSFLNSFLPQL